MYYVVRTENGVETVKPVYLDYNATTPVLPQVADAMRPFLEEHFGNPSSTHWYGSTTKSAVERARKQVAELPGCHADEIIFTSGGSEANNMAIQGIAFERRTAGNHIITSQIEHPAVIEVCRHLETLGFAVTYVSVDADGVVDVEELQRSITARTILITIMHANNEVGTIQPIAEIAALARAHGIAMHTDAAQSAGKIPVRIDELGVDLLSIAGHKLYAPKGIGALYMRRGTQIQRLIHGAAHERGLRAGTENVLEIVGLGEACAIAARDTEATASHMRTMRDRLHEALRAGVEDVILNGHPELR
ncbi:MAG: cysteine desulfurase, partial [Bacteroidetes bacterium]|nr:cysteine desulfurase [Bacteroidota bacterium]